MTALDLPIASAAVPRRPLPAVFLAAALGNAWSLHYASALLTGGTGLPPFGGLFTVHVLLATAFIAILSLRCELFIPTPGELGFFLLAGFLGNMVFSALAWSAAAFIAPLGFSLYAILLARRAPHRLNTLQVMTGVAVAATAILLPLANMEGELFLLEGRFVPSDLALTGFALTIGAEYYLLTLLARLAGTTLVFQISAPSDRRMR